MMQAPAEQEAGGPPITEDVVMEDQPPDCSNNSESSVHEYKLTPASPAFSDSSDVRRTSQGSSGSIDVRRTSSTRSLQSIEDLRTLSQPTPPVGKRLSLTAVPLFLAKELYQRRAARNPPCWLRWAEALVPLCVPFMFAWQGVGMRLAREEGTEFFSLMPAIIGSLLLIIGVFVVHLTVWGWQDLRLIFNRRLMLPPGVAGLFICGIYSCQALAFQRVMPAMVFVIMKTSILWTLLIDYLRGKGVRYMDWLLAASMITMAVSYVFVTSDDDGGSIDPVGLLLSMGAGLCAACANVALTPETPELADVSRVLLVSEVFKVLGLLVLFIAMEREVILARGPLQGWNLVVAASTLPPNTLTAPVITIALSLVGPATVAFISGFDLAVARICECVLGYADPTITSFCVIAQITLLLGIANIHDMELNHAPISMLEDLLKDHDADGRAAELVHELAQRCRAEGVLNVNPT